MPGMGEATPRDCLPTENNNVVELSMDGGAPRVRADSKQVEQSVMKPAGEGDSPRFIFGIEQRSKKVVRSGSTI